MGQAEETESTLALAENIYVNLPTPSKNTKLNFDFITVIKHGHPLPEREAAVSYEPFPINAGTNGNPSKQQVI
jgi:hypothetical protein